MGFFGKSTDEKLVDLALPLLMDENNFKIFFNILNENYVDKNSENKELFIKHWKAVLYIIIKGVYGRLGTEGYMSTTEYMKILPVLLEKIKANELGKEIFDEYTAEYYNGGFNIALILSKYCFAGKLKENSINEVRTATNDFERVFEETVEEKIKWTQH